MKDCWIVRYTMGKLPRMEPRLFRNPIDACTVSRYRCRKADSYGHITEDYEVSNMNDIYTDIAVFDNSTTARHYRDLLIDACFGKLDWKIWRYEYQDEDVFIVDIFGNHMIIEVGPKSEFI